MKQRKFKTSEQVAETFCRGCAYNTTDEERKFYGIINKDEQGNIIRQYHFCTFCVEEPAFRRRLIFWGVDYRIHLAKYNLREKALKSPGYLYKAALRQTLEEAHYEEIHHAPYKTDENGNRVYGQYEARYNRLTEEIMEIRNKPRHLYLEALEGFGGVFDEPPCTRNLSKKQKQKLLRNLKEKTQRVRSCLNYKHKNEP